MDMTKMMIDAYMKPLYDAGPASRLLDELRNFEKKLYEYAANNPGAMDIVGESGMRDEYTRLYMKVINGANDTVEGDTAQEQVAESSGIPTVHEFLAQYRNIYETSVDKENKPLTVKAYEELFAVEDRTDDLIEAQIIMEKEHLILNTLTADYRDSSEAFMAKVDPNYEVTYGTVKATLDEYAKSACPEEITYISEISRALCDDLSVKSQLKMELASIMTGLIAGWEKSKRKIRENDPVMDKYAQAMVLTRKKTKQFYRFLTEDMGMSFEYMEEDPFYRLSLLLPQGLDSLWKLKKVMHPDNIKAMRYILFEEILSAKTLEAILLTPQPYPFYGMIDSVKYPEIDEEIHRIADQINSEK